MNTTTFETGATTHAVNDLILFTDNTRLLAELRDELYKDWATYGTFGTSLLLDRFWPLFTAARKTYIEEFKRQGAGHIIRMSNAEMREYCQLYVDDFKNWKQDHGY